VSGPAAAELADCAAMSHRRGSPNRQITPALSVQALEGSFPGDLGIELVEIDTERVTGRLGVDGRHLHPGGYVHGGVWVAFADTVAAWGTMRNLPAGDNFTTSELKANVFTSATRPPRPPRPRLLTPPDGGHASAELRPRRGGGRG